MRKINPLMNNKDQENQKEVTAKITSKSIRPNIIEIQINSLSNNPHNLFKLLKYLQKTVNEGSGTDLIVESGDGKKSFYFDGDGGDRIEAVNLSIKDGIVNSNTLDVSYFDKRDINNAVGFVKKNNKS